MLIQINLFNLKKQTLLFFFKYFFLYFVIFSPFLSVSQNLYDLEHSEKFAKYLYTTRQYNLAAEEYERVVFLDSTNSDNKLKLIKLYRLSGNYSQGIKKIELFFKENIQTMPVDFAEEYLKLMLLKKSNDSAIQFLSLNKKLTKDVRNYYNVSVLLLSKQWKTAQIYFKQNQEINDERIIRFIDKTKTMKYKSPVLAASLSTIIPGLGKVYSKSWKDGLVSFILVGLNAWQAYRGFDSYGKSSFYGWFFGSMAVGLYCGNIYGSYKNAELYNKKMDNDFFIEIQRIIFNSNKE